MFGRALISMSFTSFKMKHSYLIDFKDVEKNKFHFLNFPLKCFAVDCPLKGTTGVF